MTWLLFFSFLLIWQAGTAKAEQSSTDDAIDAIGLCTVVDGRKQETVITSDQLDDQPLMTQGYLAGIKLYSAHKDISARLVDDPVVLERLTVRENETSEPSRAYLSIASKIPGDSLSLKDEVTLSVSHSEAAALLIKIRQTGYRTIYQAPPDRPTRRQPLVFRYLGSNAAQFQNAAGRGRLEALSEGIRKIERAYGQELVQNINIIDIQGYNNALSLKGRNEVWIYADTFWNNSSDELRSMASHETLHIFVDHFGLTEKPEIRALFADLMGFDPLSRERFTLLTTGHLPRSYASRRKPLSPFWGFINERHFIDGMSGGHSSDNIDEFCTSFLHSLLYSERLQASLQKAIFVEPRSAPRVTSPEERYGLLELYRKALAVFYSTVAQAGNGDGLPVVDLCSLALQRADSITAEHLQ